MRNYVICNRMNIDLPQMEVLFLALSDKTRLRLLNLLSAGEVSVFSLTEILQESQPKISRHLAYLRQADLVETRRDGKSIFYKIAKLPDEAANLAAQEILKILRRDETMQNDLQKLAAQTNTTTVLPMAQKSRRQADLPAFLL